MTSNFLTGHSRVHGVSSSCDYPLWSSYSILVQYHSLASRISSDITSTTTLGSVGWGFVYSMLFYYPSLIRTLITWDGGWNSPLTLSPMHMPTSLCRSHYAVYTTSIAHDGASGTSNLAGILYGHQPTKTFFWRQFPCLDNQLCTPTVSRIQIARK